VHLNGGATNLGNFPTAADGSFRSAGVAANSAVRVVADYSVASSALPSSDARR
jgi:hypothetical protein